MIQTMPLARSTQAKAAAQTAHPRKVERLRSTICGDCTSGVVPTRSELPNIMSQPPALTSPLTNPARAAGIHQCLPAPAAHGRQTALPGPDGFRVSGKTRRRVARRWRRTKLATEHISERIFSNIGNPDFDDTRKEKSPSVR